MAHPIKKAFKKCNKTVLFLCSPQWKTYGSVCQVFGDFFDERHCVLHNKCKILLLLNKRPFFSPNVSISTTFKCEYISYFPIFSSSLTAQLFCLSCICNPKRKSIIKTTETVWQKSKEGESSVRAAYPLPFQAKHRGYLDQTRCPWYSICSWHSHLPFSSDTAAGLHPLCLNTAFQ